MRVHAVSDVHVDYEVNAQWVESLSRTDYQQDVLILAGDLSDSLDRLERAFTAFASRFMKVLFVPGNHDLWVIRDKPAIDSFQKLDAVMSLAERCGLSAAPYHRGDLTIVPMWSWYDYTFGEPTDELLQIWMDFKACRWPGDLTPAEVTSHFLQRNQYVRRDARERIISFSHFLPRVDVMPWMTPPSVRRLYPVLGTARLEAQVRELAPLIHVYGHSHLNRRTRLSDTLYVNNAFAYPRETHIAAKELLCIHEEP